MNRNIRASYLKTTQNKNVGILVRDLDIVDNDFLLQIDAVAPHDLRNVQHYDFPMLSYRVRIEHLPTKINPMSTVVEFELTSCPTTSLTGNPLWLTAIPVDVLMASTELGAVQTILNLTFAQAIGTGHLGAAMDLLATGWVKFKGDNTLDAWQSENTTVRILYEVKYELVRYKRTTVISRLSPTKRETEVVPFTTIWPQLDSSLNAAGLEHLIGVPVAASRPQNNKDCMGWGRKQAMGTSRPFNGRLNRSSDNDYHEPE